MTDLLIRLLQGAISSTALPQGMPRPRVLAKMPSNGWPSPPFISVNLDVIQQTDVAVGEDVENPGHDNVWSLWANARRTWRVTVLTVAPEERDFFRDTLLTVFRVLKATVFSPLGLNVTHSFAARSYTAAVEWEGLNPGFYGADLLLSIDGVFPTAVMTDYAIIRDVAVNITQDPYNITITVPSQPRA